MRYEFEVALPVDAYVDSDCDETDANWEECFELCGEDIEGATDCAKEELREAGCADSLEILSAEFQEFDSSNASHACGYFNITVEGDEAEVAKLKAYIEQE